FFVLSLDHHASQILGSRITKQQSPSPLQVTLDAIGLGLDPRDRLEKRFASNANVHQNLRISSHSRCKLSERAFRVPDGSKQFDGCDQSVAGERDIRKNNVTRLLAAEFRAARQEFFENISVADRRSHQ